jgi:hypothetical protein
MDEAGHASASAGDAAGVAVAAHARYEGLDARRAAGGRDRGEHFLVDDVLHTCALDIDRRRFAGDRDSLFERADT